MLNLDEIKARAEAATPGPMEIVWDSRPDIKTELIFTKRDQGGYFDGGHIASLTHHRSWQRLLRLCNLLIKRLPSQRDRIEFKNDLEEFSPGILELAKYDNGNDAEFYCHAREDVLDLVAEVERLKVKVNRLVEALETEGAYQDRDDYVRDKES